MQDPKARALNVKFRLITPWEEHLQLFFHPFVGLLPRGIGLDYTMTPELRRDYFTLFFSLLFSFLFFSLLFSFLFFSFLFFFSLFRATLVAY